MRNIPVSLVRELAAVFFVKLQTKCVSNNLRIHTNTFILHQLTFLDQQGEPCLSIHPSISSHRNKNTYQMSCAQVTTSPLQKKGSITALNLSRLIVNPTVETSTLISPTRIYLT